MTTGQLVSFFLVFLVVALLVYVVSLYNGVQRLRNIIPEATSNIAVLRKKRTDLIAKLISIVESYDMHESGIAGKVSSDFGGPTNTSGIVQRLASLRMTFPELKADSLYESLMQELAGVETDIANRREQYNSTVRSYNIAISQFPANVVLSTFGFQPMPFLSEQELSD